MWRLKKKLFIILIFLFLFFILFSIILKSKENENIEDNLTVVSGFWKIKNKHGSKYEEEWFKNSLMINQKYVFFTSPDLIDSMKTFRTNYETIFIPYELNNFYSDKIHPLKTLHKDHVPSKELAAIWNEKIHLLKIAKDFDLKNNNLKEFYIWIDAGVCTFRNQAPPQKRLNISQSLLKTLPKNKFIYSSLEGINTDEFLEFLVSGTVLLLHHSFIDYFHEIYYEELKNCDESLWQCGSDQYIFTKLLKKNPNLFYEISKDYGGNLEYLYDQL